MLDPVLPEKFALASVEVVGDPHPDQGYGVFYDLDW